MLREPHFSLKLDSSYVHLLYYFSIRDDLSKTIVYNFGDFPPGGSDLFHSCKTRIPCRTFSENTHDLNGIKQLKTKSHS